MEVVFNVTILEFMTSIGRINFQDSYIRGNKRNNA